jgi:hypothetical protein
MHASSHTATASSAQKRSTLSSWLKRVKGLFASTSNDRIIQEPKEDPPSYQEQVRRVSRLLKDAQKEYAADPLVANHLACAVKRVQRVISQGGLGSSQDVEWMEEIEFLATTLIDCPKNSRIVAKTVVKSIQHFHEEYIARDCEAIRHYQETSLSLACIGETTQGEWREEIERELLALYRAYHEELDSCHQELNEGEIAQWQESLTARRELYYTKGLEIVDKVIAAQQAAAEPSIHISSEAVDSMSQMEQSIQGVLHKISALDNPLPSELTPLRTKIFSLEARLDEMGNHGGMHVSERVETLQRRLLDAHRDLLQHRED